MVICNSNIITRIFACESYKYEHSVLFFQCDDETCKHATRNINLQLVGDSEKGTVCPNYPRCNGHLQRKVLLVNTLTDYVII